MAQGYTDDEIAKMLDLSKTNYNLQRWRLYCYIGEVHKPMDAVYVALQNGLLQDWDLSDANSKENSRFKERVKVMKFELKQNIFATGIKKVNLTETEANYIIALVSGIKKNTIMKSLSLTKDDIEKIYAKFGLNDKKRIRDVQLATLCMTSGFTREYFEKNKNKEFKFPECQELVDAIIEMQHNEAKFKKEIEQTVEEIIEEHFNNKNKT